MINVLGSGNVFRTSDYSRDFPNDYPPAIASALLDLNTEITTDYPATIIYLCTKKYIEMHEENDNTYFSILNTNTSSLTEHEQYVYDCIFNKAVFHNDRFKEKIKEDALKLGLIEKGRRKIHFFRNFVISLTFSFVIGSLQDYVPDIIMVPLGLIASASVFGVFYGSIYLFIKYQTENYHRTTKGNKEAKKLSAFKNFLHDYTLISEKDINYTTILEEYIPYAVSLGESESIEKYISNNKLYRKILYKYSS